METAVPGPEQGTETRLHNEVQLYRKRPIKKMYLHPEEGDAGQQVHGGFQVLQPVFVAGREVVL